jgi:acetyl-CoA carboxylase biotin carboxyl carrier protein
MCPRQHRPLPIDDLFYVKAPIVGTFYKAPNPSSPPFVNVGDFVEKGTVLCIVEAMKLMNEIESEVAGQITAAFVDNGQPVELEKSSSLSSEAELTGLRECSKRS